MTEPRRSYAGACVYVGVDEHKETYTVTGVCHKQIVQTATVQAEPAGLAASLPRWFPGATLYAVYEAGFAAFVLHRVLTNAGISNMVVKPAAIAVAANDKVKTDRRDSKKLAIDLADGRWRGLSVPTEAEELARVSPQKFGAESPCPDGLPRQRKVGIIGRGMPPSLSWSQRHYA